MPKKHLYKIGLIIIAAAILIMAVVILYPSKRNNEFPPIPLNINCETVYPIVVAHHWGPPLHEECDQNNKNCIEYYYRPVISLLQERGADIRVVVYKYDYDTTPHRAQELKDFILKNYINNREYLNKWKARNPGKHFKVNIIASSQGCQDSRYMISNLGMAEYVAAWTGLVGESKGTPLADLLLSLYFKPYLTSLINWFLLTLYHREYPDQEAIDRYVASLRSLSEDYMQNKGEYGTGGKYEGKGYRADYISTIYYQSWGAKVNRIPIIWWDYYPIWRYVKWKRGDNDIYSPLTSQIHPVDKVVNRGILEGDRSSQGVHHSAFCGSLNRYNPGWDQDRFWIDLVLGLKKLGY
jgi:hypothetical protein